MATKTLKAFRLDDNTISLIDKTKDATEQSATSVLENAVVRYWQAVKREYGLRNESRRARKLALEMMHEAGVFDWDDYIVEIMQVGVRVALAVEEDDEIAKQETLKMLDNAISGIQAIRDSVADL